MLEDLLTIEDESDERLSSVEPTATHAHGDLGLAFINQVTAPEVVVRLGEIDLHLDAQGIEETVAILVDSSIAETPRQSDVGALRRVVPFEVQSAVSRGEPIKFDPIERLVSLVVFQADCDLVGTIFSLVMDLTSVEIQAQLLGAGVQELVLFGEDDIRGADGLELSGQPKPPAVPDPSLENDPKTIEKTIAVVVDPLVAESPHRFQQPFKSGGAIGVRFEEETLAPSPAGEAWPSPSRVRPDPNGAKQFRKNVMTAHGYPWIEEMAPDTLTRWSLAPLKLAERPYIPAARTVT